MLQRGVDRYRCEKRSIWVFLHDQQRWIEETLFVELEGDRVTLRYEGQDDDELHSWEEIVRLDSIGAVSTHLEYFSSSALPEDLETTSACLQSERLSNES